MRGKRAVLNIVSSVFVQFVTIICGFIIPRLIIGSYGSKVNGAVSSMAQFLGFIILLESGFGPVIKSMLFKPIANKDKATIEKILKASEAIFRKISYFFILYIIILCVFFSIRLQNDFNIFFTISLIVIISISTFSEYFFGMTYNLYLQAEQKLYISSGIKAFSVIINTIVVFVLIKFGAPIQIVKLASSLIYVIRPIFQMFYVKRRYGININKVKEKYNIKQKWDGLAQHIAYVMYNNTDVAVLTICGNLSEVSVYSIYYTIVNKIKGVVQSFVGGIDATFGDMIAKNEKENLNKSFRIYEGLYFSISSIVFCSTMLLIIPFIKLYMRGITDTDYIRPVFAYLMVLSQFIITIRQPYNDLVKVSGSFRQTMIGAWIEAISNIVISVALVWKLGIIGVVIGTVVAVFIRTIEFMCYTSKNILGRSVWSSLGNLVLILVEFVIIFVIMHFIPNENINNYSDLLIRGIFVLVISVCVVCLINYCFYKNSFKFLKNKIINKLCRKDDCYDK